ncbi:MAG: hypothetical protein PHU98_14155 [Mariniphaga sp.]|nr:hypothetical protein [Mariniphaga sp.]
MKNREDYHSMHELKKSDLIKCTGGGFAYDVGAALGWLVRANSPLGVGYANAVWAIQYDKL